MTDPGTMSGLFLTACRSLATLTGDEVVKARALKYKVECIQSAKNDIESSEGMISDATIMKALYLASDEVRLVNYSPQMSKS
jgi:hypothetical protein